MVASCANFYVAGAEPSAMGDSEAAPAAEQSAAAKKKARKKAAAARKKAEEADALPEEPASEPEPISDSAANIAESTVVAGDEAAPEGGRIDDGLVRRWRLGLEPGRTRG